MQTFRHRALTSEPSPTPGGLDGGDVDFRHLHHCRKCALRFIAAAPCRE
jgi:hypothetical protein